MPSYLRIWRQGGGCDYTIGCGIRVERIDAASLDAAREMTLSDIVDSDGEFIENLESVEITEVAAPNLKLVEEHWAEARAASRAAKKKAQADAKDKAEYERLQKKFGGGK